MIDDALAVPGLEPAAAGEPEFCGALRKGLNLTLFATVLAMFPYTQDPTGDIKYFIISAVSAVLTCAWLYWSWRARAPFRRPQLFFVILLLLLGVLGVSSAVSSYPGNAFDDWRKFASLFLLYLVASQVYRTPRQLRNTVLVLCAAMGIASLYAIILQHNNMDFFPWSDTTSDVYTNLPGTFGNPNYTAHALILIIVLSVYVAWAWRQPWLLAATALFLVHLRFTHQRAGIIALAGALTLVVTAKIVMAGVRRPARGIVFTLLAVTIIGAAGLGGAMAYSKIRHGSQYPLDLSLLVRYKSYCSAAKMILAKPIIGYGAGNYTILYSPFWTPYEQKWFAQELKKNAHVHNDLLELGVDGGLPAAGLYLAFLVFGICYGLHMAYRQPNAKRRRLGLAFAAFFAVFLIDGLFGFNLRVPVSALILFVIAGAMEGMWSGMAIPRPARVRTPWLGRAAKAAAVIVCISSLGWAIAVFFSQVMLQRGSAEFYWKRLEPADRFFVWGERFAPWNWHFERQRGLISLARDDANGAREHFSRSLEKNPYYIMTLLPLGRSEIGAGIAASDDFNAAMAYFDRASAYGTRILELCPTFAPAEDMLGRVSVGRALASAKASGSAKAPKSLDAWREAETHFSRALEYGAKNTDEIYKQLAQVRTALDDRNGIEDAYIRATQADPADDSIWPAFYGFARTNKRYDRFKNALMWRIQRLGEGTEKKTELATAYLWLATILQEGYNDVDGAETGMRAAVHTLPLNPEPWAAYAKFARENNRLDGFKQFLLEAYSRIVTAGQKPLPHVAALAKAWKKGPDTLLESSVLLVEVMHGKYVVPGLKPADLDMQWAIDMLNEEVEKANLGGENGGMIRLHFGMVSAAVNSYDAAVKNYAAAMPLLPENIQRVCAQHYADALVRLHRAGEAVELLRAEARKAPDDTDVQIALARTLAVNGQNDEATKQYNALLQSPNIKPEEKEKIRQEFDLFQSNANKTKPAQP